MLVKDYMTRHPVMVDPDMSIVEAQNIMSETQVRHLPVTGEGKRLVGLITRQRMRIPPTELASLNVWEITRFLSNLCVRDVMVKRKNVITTTPDATLEEAAKIMIDNKIGSLPVLEDDIVIGIITEIDMMTQLTDLLGGNEPGVRVTIRMPNRKGELAKATGAISDQGWGIYASGGVKTPKDPDHWDCVIKVRGVSQEELVNVLKTIEGQEIIDVR
ncbi:MAG: CBS domain-containing protein [Anaerolineales bacterium]|nr:CBS domain-containing protein [Anaerolineales bacterium]